MARPKAFDEDRALDAAMRAFWATGYEATSTQDLCAATGLRRSSIYNTFTSKRDLYEAALDRYMADKTAGLVALLEEDRPLRDKVRDMMWRVVDPGPGDPVGCLVVTSTVELAPQDPGIAARLRRDQDRRLEALRAAIDAGRRSGEVDRGRDPAALAHFVVAAISGMQVAAYGGADRATLEAIARTALTAL
ncbi:TetR/AcrR family transcriptional regulator [Nocardiopsis sediminis]|uniref:TetR/AcrR family transcriptional regulator n=1 Tax=Nocardiopsis sediminis TaxID=1778267 RepID=A0ABV8FDR6_9ACTN